jgi:glycosyltransferase 2 family protein
MTVSNSRWWPWLRRVLTLGFFSLLVWLLVGQATELDWAEVWQAVRSYSPGRLALALALSFTSYAAYCCFDLIGKAYTRHDLPTPAVLLTAFISYAFNLNFGALIGGAGFRYRLYSRRGLGTADISRVVGLSILGNWSGYFPLLGWALLSGALPVPEALPVGEGAMQAIGLLSIALTAVYLAACAFSSRRSWTLRGHQILLPSASMASLQVGLSMVCWSMIAAIVHVLTWQQIPYTTVLAVLLLAAVAGAVTHVPAGLGVLEAVFITMLGNQIPRSELLASLLVYRAVYYLSPLLVALVVFLLVEVRGRPGREPRPAP